VSGHIRHRRTRPDTTHKLLFGYMKKIIVTVGTIAGSWLGWWLGSQVGGLMTAFILSMVGTGAGLYFSRRFTQG